MDEPPAVERVMLDTETLGTEPGAIVLSVGAARFDLDGVTDTLYRSIDMIDAQEHGLTIDANTLDWWLYQDEEAKEVLYDGSEMIPALEALASFVVNADEVWANSPSFDCRLLEAAYDAIGVGTPWEYYEERDYRTLKRLPITVDWEPEGVDHNALDDAVNQAEYAAEVLGWMEEGRRLREETAADEASESGFESSGQEVEKP